jgi:hypothetical protein
LQRFPRGSEWRKWDLHVHAPGTKLNDCYGSPPDWDRFCRILEESDVDVFGLTDYFALDTFFACVEHFRRLYPSSRKVFFPNLELRLTESVDASGREVHAHLLLRPDLDSATAERLLQELKTEVRTTDGHRRPLSCLELRTKREYESATVTRDRLKEALRIAFGDGRARSDNALLIVPASNDGLRPEKGSKRKSTLAVEIDWRADAIFGNENSAARYLDPDRAGGDQRLPPKPVFGGCDAHGFHDLERWLGRVDDSEASHKTVTWIKADPTYEGLLQTLVEPEARVRLQATRPDGKEPYKCISRVRFSGTNDFPSEIPFNSNLVSIIGSRSSGKSALLAYIAHAVDPDHTVAQQIAAGIARDRKDAGPAAGKTWAEVVGIRCEVEWGSGTTTAGQVIYIPQNSLYSISERPLEITVKIEPTLHRLDPEFAVAHRRALRDIATANDIVRQAVSDWFRLSEALSTAVLELRNLGDRAAVEATRAELEQGIAELREGSSLSREDVDNYQLLVDALARIAERRTGLEDDTRRINTYLTRAGNGYAAASSVGVEIRPTPPLSELPDALQASFAMQIETAATQLSDAIRRGLEDHQLSVDRELAELATQEAQLRADNAELIGKNQANAEIEALVASKKKQDQVLADILKRSASVSRLRTELGAEIDRIRTAVEARGVAEARLAQAFATRDRTLDPMTFGFEQRLAPETHERISERFNRRDIGELIRHKGDPINIEACQASPEAVLNALWSGSQRIRSNQDPLDVAADVLTATPEVRFSAQIEGDRIGGFGTSSMTPGKQALFALTLILNESEEAWPLLIDQPEDDLDSRSIYETLVRYLCRRKTERQVIMVSHNANLVIGADSEQVMVANRHGDDRRNRNGRTFDYLTGSLEHSRRRSTATHTLEMGGIREHACDILDGGEDAFRKRQEKYKIV